MNVLFVVFVPVTHADAIRKMLGDVGAGKVGNYDYCSFSCRGVGRFRGNVHACPAIGAVGVLEAVEEERIECIVPRVLLQDVINKVKSVHPYEEPALYACPFERV